MSATFNTWPDFANWKARSRAETFGFTRLLACCKSCRGISNVAERLIGVMVPTYCDLLESSARPSRVPASGSLTRLLTSSAGSRTLPAFLSKSDLHRQFDLKHCAPSRADRMRSLLPSNWRCEQQRSTREVEGADAQARTRPRSTKARRRPRQPSSK